jgi:anti-anti-sigma factor
MRWRTHRRACPGGPRLLAVTGELDLFTTSGWAEQLARSPSVRVLDLSGVTFIDAAGLRILIEATRADPTLVIRASSVCVRRLCAIAGLDEIASAAATERAAAQPGTVRAIAGEARVPGGCRRSARHRHLHPSRASPTEGPRRDRASSAWPTASMRDFRDR